MAMNNMGDMMKMFQAWNTFKDNHPKFPAFLSAAKKMGVEEDTVIGVEMTSPAGEKIATNIKVKASDLELFRTLLEMKK